MTVSLFGAMDTSSDEAAGRQKIDGMLSNLRRVLVGCSTSPLVRSLETSSDVAIRRRKFDEGLYS